VTKSEATTEAPDKGPHRRDMILDAAVSLFREHGFDATGIDEIGAAAGITGPGVYRHFASKQDLLDAVVRESSMQVLESEREIRERARTPRELIELLAAQIVDQVLDNPGAVVVLLRERRNLSRDGRLAWNRALNAYIAEWVEPLRALRPGLGPAEARTIVFVALGIIMAVATSDDTISRRKLAPRVRAMLLAAVLAEAT